MSHFEPLPFAVDGLPWSAAPPNESSRLYPDVSIIVPVFNDQEGLEKCLQRLGGQSYPRDRYEVIVADNGSDRNIRDVVARYPRTRFICEKRPGSYAARNAGLTLATGEIVGFTDSDCLPRHDWIERGVAALQNDVNLGLAGGRVVLFHRDPQRLSPGEFYQEICGFPQEKYIEEKRFAVTANVFTWRKVLDDVGHFSPQMKSSGDKEWGNRVFEAGYGQVYAEDVVVEHPSRHRLRDLVRKRRRITGGRIQYNKIRGVEEPPLLEEFHRMRKFPEASLERFRDHPLLESEKNRTRFRRIHYLINISELYEIFRLRLGGAPRRQ